MDADLDTLATALYVATDELMAAHPERVPERPTGGFPPLISDAEVCTLAVMQALLGFTSERRWLRHANTHLAGMFPHLPKQPGYNKRLRRLAGTMTWLTRQLRDSTDLIEDDVWVADSTPVECGRSRETVHRSELAGYAEYGYCASHSRYFWGLRLHLLCTLHGLPVGWAVTGAKADERLVLMTILDTTPGIDTAGATVIADKNYYGKAFEEHLTNAGITLLRKARSGEKPRPGERFFKPMRQIIESINETFKGQLDLERHGGHTITGVYTRITQRVLALTAAIWHNTRIGAPTPRSLTAYDH